MLWFIGLVILCYALHFAIEAHKKERFLADPARGMAEMQYEQAQKQAAQQKWLGLGGGLLKLILSK